MAQEFPTFTYDDDKVVAFHGNTVVASGTDFSKVRDTAYEYFDELKKEAQTKDGEEARRTATHITTPNGDDGTILGRTAGLWSDEITVRFDNGQIRRYATYVGDGLEYSVKQAADAPKSPIEYFERRLDEVTEPGRKGLTARLNVLEDVRKGAARLAATASSTDGQALHRIVLTADAERSEVRDALEYLANADAEAMTPPTRQYTAVEQADMGRSDSWLDVVAKEMVAESEEEDFDKLLDEGPTKFVSGLETGALGNAGTVRELAAEHIHARTAGFQGEAVEEYRTQFVASTEMARRQELRYRKDELHKEAAVHEAASTDAPDEALFL